MKVNTSDGDVVEKKEDFNDVDSLEEGKTEKSKI